MDDVWALQPYQRGEGRYYLEHIQQGVRWAAKEADWRLMFSGGYTHPEHPTRSEAESYRQVAEAQSWWGHPELAERTLTETFARDSYENLRFSLFRFYDALGAWPSQIIVVGWRFKEQRFWWYAATLGWPAERFRYVGVNDPPDLDAAQAGETLVLQDFLADPHEQGGRLAAKRRVRNPFHRQPPVHWQTRLVLPKAF
ncbi:MAG: ElyC/SanA/YdcF family protein [Acidobacteriota bacterium]